MEKISKKTLVSGGILILIVALGIISYVFSINKKVATWNDKIYPEINRNRFIQGGEIYNNICEQKKLSLQRKYVLYIIGICLKIIYWNL